MRALAATEVPALAGWLDVERPGPDAILTHVAGTGHGRAWADRWSEPLAVLVETGGNFLLAGEPAAVAPEALHPLIHGFLAADPRFDSVLEQAFPGRTRWDRVVYRLPDRGRGGRTHRPGPDPARR